MGKSKKPREIRCFNAWFSNPDIESDGNSQLVIRRSGEMTKGVKAHLLLSEMAAEGWKLDYLLQRDPIRFPDKFTAIMSRKVEPEGEKHGD